MRKDISPGRAFLDGPQLLGPGDGRVVIEEGPQGPVGERNTSPGPRRSLDVDPAAKQKLQVCVCVCTLWGCVLGGDHAAAWVMLTPWPSRSCRCVTVCVCTTCMCVCVCVCACACCVSMCALLGGTCALRHQVELLLLACAHNACTRVPHTHRSTWKVRGAAEDGLHKLPGSYFLLLLILPHTPIIHTGVHGAAAARDAAEDGGREAGG